MFGAGEDEANVAVAMVLGVEEKSLEDGEIEVL